MRVSVQRSLFLSFATKLLFLPFLLLVVAWMARGSREGDLRVLALSEQGRQAEVLHRALATPSLAGQPETAARLKDLDRAARGFAGEARTGFEDRFQAMVERARSLVARRTGEIATADPPLLLGIGEAERLEEEIGAALQSAHQEARAQRHRAEQATYWTLVVGVLLMIGASYLVSRSFLKPLAALTAAAQRMAEGDISQAADLPRQHELRVLADAFNRLRDRLSQLIAQLKSHADAVSATASSIMAVTYEMAAGAQRQSVATEETSSAMEEIAAQIQGVSRNANELANDSSLANTSTKQISVSAGTVAHTAEELNAALGRGAVTVGQMVELARASATDLTSAAQLARQISDEAHNGGAAVSESLEKVAEVGEATLNSTEAFDALSQRSRQITGIVETMAEIADQTNLLALNAAIEAARAGDSGRGFAVVAEEVRKLAERAMGAAKEVAQLLGALREQIEHSVASARQNADRTAHSSRSLTEIGGRIQRMVDSITRVNELVAKVGGAANTQADAAVDLRLEMEKLRGLSGTLSQSAATQVNAATEVAQAVERISQRTRLVADATVQVRSGGDQVVKSAENISVVARQSLEAVQKVSGDLKQLSSRVVDLRQHAESLRVEP
jgi:methyl-accepting chemotaxis protein